MKIQNLPGPRPIPLLGNLHQFDRAHPNDCLAAWADEFGPVFTFRLMKRKFVAFLKRETILAALKERPVKFRRIGSVETVFREMGTHGLFSAEGEEWRRQRTLTMPTFNSQHLLGFFDTLSTVVDRLARRWDRSASRGLDIEVQKDLMRFTVDVTTNLAFGYDMNTLEQGEDVIQQHLEKIFPAIAKRITAPFPYWHYFKLPKDREVERSMAVIRKTIEQFIAKSRARLEANPELRTKPSNFLEGLLVGADNAPSGISDDDLIGNVLTILLAGEDTTANSISWMLHLMATYPEVQAKMREEVDRVLGDSDLPQNFQQMGQLPYTEAVVMESLRFRPVATFLFLQANQDTELEGIDLPKDTIVALLTGHAGIQEENFTDAKAFRPERWLTPPPVHHPRAMLVFGEGPRFCPGRNLALLEMKTVAAMVTRHFQLSPPRNGTEPKAIYQFVVVPQDLWVRFDRRVP